MHRTVFYCLFSQSNQPRPKPRPKCVSMTNVTKLFCREIIGQNILDGNIYKYVLLRQPQQITCTSYAHVLKNKEVFYGSEYKCYPEFAVYSNVTQGTQRNKEIFHFNFLISSFWQQQTYQKHRMQ